MNWQRFQTSASLALLRTLLFCVNVIFMFTGGILILLGIAIRSHFQDFLDITPDMSSTSPYILIGLGVIILLVGFSAFWCTFKGHVTLLYVYSVVILLVLIAEVVLAGTIFMRKRTYEQTFKTVVRKVMQQYPRRPMKSHIDHLQRGLQCCGIDSYADWFETPYGGTHHQVPQSCCKQLSNHTCMRTDLEKENLLNDIHTNGCYSTVILAIKSNYLVFGGIIMTIALFPLTGIILACCLAHQLSKHRYERVD
ncbi:unnamed protein product [Adineta steineri]|uniref:Tetraspanin n=2 Tax=Adineta steineri TaxID=433720 RepID=A0A819CJJ0_9BILA|nr:unnamed protein product [Adineta steineri]CAF3813338.1 unnamed protein product [Adineta steineri]